MGLEIERRGDVGLGGAARVPTGDLRTPDDPFGSGYVEAADAGGVLRIPSAVRSYIQPNTRAIGKPAITATHTQTNARSGISSDWNANAATCSSTQEATT